MALSNRAAPEFTLESTAGGEVANILTNVQPPV